MKTYSNYSPMDYKSELLKLFEKWSGEKTISISPLPISGSARKYFRISSVTQKAIGAYNPDARENRAFIYLSKHFETYKLPVPRVYKSNIGSHIYLQEDLGDQTLFSLLEQRETCKRFDAEMISLYKKTLSELPRFQITASKKLDYSFCYPRAKFDKQSMMWDLNYFKYYFLKGTKISFDEQKLENDFNELTAFLLQADSNYFMYRDFNSRNVMIRDGEPYFIDYQGGRKGALQYDVASLLFDSKANIPFELRDEFLEYYLEQAGRIKKINKRAFKKYYYGFVLIRLMQMLGAYGYRGYFEGKAHFLKSIPFAQKNLLWVLENHNVKIKLPELLNALIQIANSNELKKFEWKQQPQNKLTVHVNSFSYREKIPYDLSGNGGGFVFDCRALHNPGRYNEYKNLTGKDKPVIDFLGVQPEVQKFMQSVYAMVDESIEKYLLRGFTNLMISFGCTGGQHRSVYCAENLALHLKENFDIEVILTHSNL